MLSLATSCAQHGVSAGAGVSPLRSSSGAPANPKGQNPRARPREEEPRARGSHISIPHASRLLGPSQRSR